MSSKKEKYWENFYSTEKVTSKPSSFAEYCVNNFLTTKKNILELGSGNGRDALYLAAQGHSVHGVDLSHSAIESDTKQSKELSISNMAKFTVGDFTKIGNYITPETSVIYSRFTLHAIKKEAQNFLLKEAFDRLAPGSIFLAEARTLRDPLYGEGEKIGEHEFVTSHYRRFICTDEFTSYVKELGFKIDFFEEANNLSVYQDDNPFLMRVLLRKE